MYQKNKMTWNEILCIRKKNKIITLAFVTGCNSVVRETRFAVYVVYFATPLNTA